MENKRNYALDFFKIVATILIVFHHYQQVLNIEFESINFYGGGVLFWLSSRIFLSYIWIFNV